MKGILKCTHVDTRGREHVNELKLNEVHLVKTIAREHGEVKVEFREVDEEEFKLIFGE